MTKTVVIIQARMNSSRLPGKVLRDLGGRTVLAHVIERCKAIKNADVICCAVPESTESDPVAAEAEKNGATVFRGSEEDVLSRYYEAAKMLSADVVLRVTSDCPLIDPGICASVIQLLETKGVDFSTNNAPPTWPHGLDCEAMTFACLGRAHQEVTDPQERQHVTLFIRRHPNVRRTNLSGPGGPLLSHRWTLDYSEDLDFLRALFNVLPVKPKLPNYEQILDTLNAHPEISAINAIHKNPNHDPESIPAHDLVG